MCVYCLAKAETKCQKKLVEPPKSVFMSFETKTLKKILLHISLSFGFKNDRRTNVVLVNIFFNVLKKGY